MLVTRVLEISKLSSLGNCSSEPDASYENKRWKRSKHEDSKLAKEQSLESRGMLVESRMSVGGFHGTQLLLQRPLRMSGIERSVCTAVASSSMSLWWQKAFRRCSCGYFSFLNVDQLQFHSVAFENACILSVSLPIREPEPACNN